MKSPNRAMNMSSSTNFRKRDGYTQRFEWKNQRKIRNKHGDTNGSVSAFLHYLVIYRKLRLCLRIVTGFPSLVRVLMKCKANA